MGSIATTKVNLKGLPLAQPDLEEPTTPTTAVVKAFGDLGRALESIAALGHRRGLSDEISFAIFRRIASNAIQSCLCDGITPLPGDCFGSLPRGIRFVRVALLPIQKCQCLVCCQCWERVDAFLQGG